MSLAPKPERPKVSAVLCTCNRAELLRSALGALCGQTLDRGQFEVIVIDDGSTDDTGEVARAFATLLPLRYFRQANAGLAAAKNHGLSVARGPIVLFLDDDDVVDSDCLAEHLCSHEQHADKHVAVLGHTALATQVARLPLMHFVTEVGCYLFSYPALRDGAMLDYTYFWGGRSSCKKALLMEYGVFNPVFRFGCEDIELGYRLHTSAGLHVLYNAKARSTMVRSLDFDAFCRRCAAQGRSNAVFAEIHPAPEIRSWAQVDGIDDEWSRIAPRFEQIMKAGRELDRVARERVEADLPLDELTLRLLHRAYHAAFNTSRIKGTAERGAPKELPFRPERSNVSAMPTQSTVGAFADRVLPETR